MLSVEAGNVCALEASQLKPTAWLNILRRGCRTYSVDPSFPQLSRCSVDQVKNNQVGGKVWDSRRPRMYVRSDERIGIKNGSALMHRGSEHHRERRFGD